MLGNLQPVFDMQEIVKNNFSIGIGTKILNIGYQDPHIKWVLFILNSKYRTIYQGYALILHVYNLYQTFIYLTTTT